MSINFALGERMDFLSDASGFLHALASERTRLGFLRKSLGGATAWDGHCRAQVDARIGAIDALIGSYQRPLPGDVRAGVGLKADREEIVVGPLRINTKARCASLSDGGKIDLTNTQFRVLEILALADGSDVSRNELSLRLFHRPWNGSRGIDQIVFYLNNKLPRLADGSKMIRSVRGCGYWMRA